MVYILPTVIFAIIYNIPKFFELTVNSEHNVTNTSMNKDGFINNLVRSMDENDTLDVGEKIGPTSLRLHPLYIKVYLIYLNLITHGIIPFVLLIVLNISIYRQVCHNRDSDILKLSPSSNSMLG